MLERKVENHFSSSLFCFFPFYFGSGDLDSGRTFHLLLKRFAIKRYFILEVGAAAPRSFVSPCALRTRRFVMHPRTLTCWSRRPAGALDIRHRCHWCIIFLRSSPSSSFLLFFLFSSSFSPHERAIEHTNSRTTCFEYQSSGNSFRIRGGKGAIRPTSKPFVVGQKRRTIDVRLCRYGPRAIPDSSSWLSPLWEAE